MNHFRSVTIAAVALSLLGSLLSPVAADERHRDERHRDERQRYERHFDSAPRREHGYVLDRRYHHDRYYPPRGYVVDAPPRGYHIVRHGGVPYYYYGGIWYRPSGPRFVVVIPPIGVVVPVLPPFYTTIWVGGAPYYYADGTYYAWRAQDNGYAVVAPPAESDVTTLPPDQEQQLYIYPKKGQSEEQQADDRYECHRWAVTQTGFDPTQPPTTGSPSQYAAERADYQRAMKACLDARGYSVR